MITLELMSVDAMARGEEAKLADVNGGGKLSSSLSMDSATSRTAQKEPRLLAVRG